MTRQTGNTTIRWTLLARTCWRLAWVFAWSVTHLLYRIRVWGQENMPQQGGVLLIANHQSFLDPLILSQGCGKRYFVSMARKTLFDHWGFGWFIRTANSIPVDQDATDLKAMRLCIKALQQDQLLVVFPEGARTLTGATEPFSNGIITLIKRSKATIVPAAIEGAFDIWPRHQKRPHLFGKRIGLKLGPPLSYEAFMSQDPKKALEQLRNQVEAMRLEIRKELNLDKA